MWAAGVRALTKPILVQFLLSALAAYKARSARMRSVSKGLRRDVLRRGSVLAIRASVAVVDPDAKPFRGAVSEDVAECVRTLVANQEHALVGLVCVAEVVTGIVDADGLPALGQRLLDVAKRLAIWISREWRHLGGGFRRISGLPRRFSDPSHPAGGPAQHPGSGTSRDSRGITAAPW
jgi:hypothetical protein